MSRPDIALRLNLIPGGGGIDPTRRSVIESKEFKQFAPIMSKVESSILEGDMIIWPNHPKVPKLLQLLADALVAAMEKRQTPKAALDACQLKWINVIQHGKQ